MSTTVQKWGNSLGIRIPKHLARQARLYEGTRGEVVAERNRIVVRPVIVPTLGKMLRGLDRNSRPELVDWAGPVGREVW